MELSEKGTLRNQMINHGRFEEKVALKYIGQILNGFGELVLNGIIHRDLKPENILMKNDVIKIADFGFAKQTANGSLMNSIVGTPAYMAPQILSEQQYSYKCDIWALGVIMYELVVGRIPWTFKEKNLQSVCK